MKVREDPLFLIRKKEKEARKQLVSNPVKMKQLQDVGSSVCVCMCAFGDGWWVCL